MLKPIRKFSTKLLLCLIFGILLPVGILFIVLSGTYRDLLKDEIRRNTENVLLLAWEELEDVFSRMVTLSTIINNDSMLIGALDDPALSHYDRYMIFDNLLRTIHLSNFGLGDSVYVHLTDQWGAEYCNLAAYPIVPDTDFQAKIEASRGSLCWNFNAYDHSGKKFFSLARVFYQNNSLQNPVAMLTISIPEEQIVPILTKFLPLEQNCMLLYLDDGEFITGYYESDQPISHLYGQSTAYLAGRGKNSFVETIDGVKYLVNTYSLSSMFDFEGHTLHALFLSEYDAVFGEVEALFRRIAVLLSIFYVLIWGLAYAISRQMVVRIRKLDTQVRSFQVGRSFSKPEKMGADEIGNLYLEFCQLTASVNSLFAQLKQENIVKENYRYESLRAQINPHFLFNTLNSIKFSAQIIHAENIVQNIDALSRMLRYSMTKESDWVTLEREIDNIRNYLCIQNNRFGNSVHLELDESVTHYRENLVYKFILQPVVENCILHGFKDYTDHGIIFISCCEEEDCFVICVCDNGRGFSEEAMRNWCRPDHEKPAHFNGLGLSSVHQLIRISCGPQYGLTIKSTPYESSKVIYRLPVKKSQKEDAP